MNVKQNIHFKDHLKSSNPIIMNEDCWIEIFKKLSPRDRQVLLLVNRFNNKLVQNLNFHQKCLRIINNCETNVHWSVQTNNTFQWNSSCFGFTDFKRLLSLYPRLVGLEITGVKHLADHHLFSITELCPKLRSLQFYSCPYLSDYFESDFGFHQATQVGWKRLLTGFEQQITCLVLEDCDLDNKHFRLLVENCKVIEHLNVSNNSQITDYSPLQTSISSHIQTLKLGPKLGSNRQQIRCLLNVTNSLIKDIVMSERCNGLLTLQLHCVLTLKLLDLVKLPFLKRLTLKFINLNTFSENIISHQTNILQNILCNFSKLKHLHFYQINYNVMNDLNWSRDITNTFYGNDISHYLNENHNLWSESFVTIENNPEIALKLENFSFYTNDITKINNSHYLLLFKYLFKTYGINSLKCLSFSTLNIHKNVNDFKILNNLLFFILEHLNDFKYIEILQFENIFHNIFYDHIINVLLDRSRNGLLNTFVMSYDEQITFLEYVYSLSLTNRLSDLNVSSLSKINFIGQSTESNNKSSIKNNESSINLMEDFFQKYSFRFIESKELSQNEWNLRFINEINKNNNENNLNHHSFLTIADGHLNSLPSNDNDLSDLCQLLDSSFGLVDNIIDLITLSTNYIVIVLTCALMLKPFNLINSASTVIKIFLQNLFIRLRTFSN